MNPFIGWYQWKRDNLLSGWIECPVCDGQGVIWNRFTHHARKCKLCDGRGLVDPAKVVKQKRD